MQPDINKDLHNLQNKQSDYPKEPPTPYYNFFVKDKNSEMVRNNPGMNSIITITTNWQIVHISQMDISSFVTRKMFKTLGDEKNEEKYELAREAKEKYKKQVQKFNKWVLNNLN